MNKCFLTQLAVAAATTGSPIAKVLDLLGSLEKKVLVDGEAEQKQYERFSAWCKDSAVQLQHEIAVGQDAAAALEAVIEKEAADAAAAGARIEDLSVSIAQADKELQDATDVRKAENGDFTKEQIELQDTVDMLRRARSILSRHVGSVDAALLQSLTTSLSALVTSHAGVFSHRDVARVQALLQSEDINQPSVKAYESHSGAILSTLEDLQDRAEGLLSDLQKHELQSKHAYDLVAQALHNELKHAGEDLAAQKAAAHHAAEAKAAAERDLVATRKELSSDQEQLADTSVDCQDKATDWEASQASRAEELKVLAEAKAVISSKTGGAASRSYTVLMQTADSSDAVARVERLVKRLASPSDVAFSQLSNAVSAAAAAGHPFGKVKGLIESMINKLENAAAEDASHEAFCVSETTNSESKLDKHQTEIAKLTARSDKASASIAKRKAEIAELNGQLAELAASQAEMDRMRASEKKENAARVVDFSDGVECVQAALTTLREYYTESAVSESLLQAAPAVSVHAPAVGAASGIIGLLEVAESDFARSLAETKSSEASAQDNYDRVTQDNRVARVQKKSAVAYKTKEVAQLEKFVDETGNDVATQQAELDAVLEYLTSLRSQCVRKPETYEERKERREREIAGLKEALRILEEESSGSSFLQVI